MYINDIHIIYYILIGIIGLVIGQFIDWCNLRLPEYKKIFSKEFFTIYMKNFKVNYILAFGMAIIYIAILYFIGFQSNILYQLKLLKYLTLAPMLVSALVIDWKLQIIPNRLNLTIFEAGLAFAFAQGICNFSIGRDMLIGSLVGAGIFLIITLLGGIIAGKEAMGFGDVKLMGALGLFVGWINIILISLISFLLAGVIIAVLLLTKKKKSDEYIPFGPFIVLATFIVMLVSSDVLLTCIFKILGL